MVENNFILVVDDDSDIRESICDLLQDEGCRAVGVANGQEALDALVTNGLPCVILLDLMMPIMDGAEFRKRQLADRALADIPVVLITAAGAAASKGVPSNRVIPKPLKAESLIDAVTAFCTCAV